MDSLCVTFNHGKVANIYTVYEMSKTINISDYPNSVIVYLEQSIWLKTLISTVTIILDMELDLIDMEESHFLALD